MTDRVDELSVTIGAVSERQEWLKGPQEQFCSELADERDELDEVRDMLDNDLPEKRAATQD